MNLKQLRCFCEIANANLVISDAARALHVSQPGVSKQLRELEDELGVALFTRGNNRLLKLTPIAKKVLVQARKVILTAESIRVLCRDAALPDTGELKIITTHAHARFLLPHTLKRFRADHKNVRILVEQGLSNHIQGAVASGSADIGISPKVGRKLKELAYVNCKITPRVLVVPRGHVLARGSKLSLGAIARYPVIITQPGTSQTAVLKAFAGHGITPKFVLSVSDTDVAKACVEEGLGIAILPEYVFDANRDRNLQILPVSAWFEAVTTIMVTRRNYPLPGYGKAFVELLTNSFQLPAIGDEEH